MGNGAGTIRNSLPLAKPRADRPHTLFKIFCACDDDKSGYLSIIEYKQLATTDSQVRLHALVDVAAGLRRESFQATANCVTEAKQSGLQLNAAGVSIREPILAIDTRTTRSMRTNKGACTCKRTAACMGGSETLRAGEKVRCVRSGLWDGSRA
eukprot:3370520-Pleurochrysis_carterae.AAC.3